MSQTDIQLATAAYLQGVDVMQRLQCAEKACPVVAPLAAFVCYRVWRGEDWKYFAFCNHEHALACFPVTALGQA